MTTHKEALTLALEALSKSDDFLFEWHDNESDNEADAYANARQLNVQAITAIKEALMSVPDGAQPEQRSVSEQQEPVAIPEWPESESLADLEYAQNIPETWEPEYRQVWQELQVAERNKAILRRYAKELRALLTTPPQHSAIARKPLTEGQRHAIIQMVATVGQAIDMVEAAHGIKE